MFVSGMVGYDTSQLRRESTHIIHILNYCLILADRLPCCTRIDTFLDPRAIYMYGVGRRQHRLLSYPPMWRSPQADKSPTAKAIDADGQMQTYFLLPGM